jgi:hypothetical protein
MVGIELGFFCRGDDALLLIADEREWGWRPLGSGDGVGRVRAWSRVGSEQGARAAA